MLKRGDCCDTFVTFSCADWCLQVTGVMTNFISHSLVVGLLDHIEDFLLDMGVEDFLFNKGDEDFLFDLGWSFSEKISWILCLLCVLKDTWDLV
jgi:hypothetical protein